MFKFQVLIFFIFKTIVSALKREKIKHTEINRTQLKYETKTI